MQTLIENVNIVNPFDEIKTGQNVLIEDKNTADCFERVVAKSKFPIKLPCPAHLAPP